MTVPDVTTGERGADGEPRAARNERQVSDHAMRTIVRQVQDTEMTSFHLASHRRGSPRDWAVYTVFLSLLFLLAWLGSHSIVGLVVASIIGLLPIVLSLRIVVELRVLETGALEVVRRVGVTRIAARDLFVIEGYLNRGYDGEDEWKMCLRHRDGRIYLEQFAGTTAFIEAVRGVNPAVQITGVWPQGVPGGRKWILRERELL